MENLGVVCFVAMIGGLVFAYPVGCTVNRVAEIKHEMDVRGHRGRLGPITRALSPEKAALLAECDKANPCYAVRDVYEEASCESAYLVKCLNLPPESTEKE